MAKTEHVNTAKTTIYLDCTAVIDGCGLYYKCSVSDIKYFTVITVETSENLPKGGTV
jgi:hypothetical protein